MLTTITSCWNRPDVLKVWMKALSGATIPQTKHILFMPGASNKDIPRIPKELDGRFEVITTDDKPPKSIGYYHNLGANMADTPWMMKMDVDTMPHVSFFSELLPVLRSAREREWFNIGMLYINQHASATFLNESKMPLDRVAYKLIMRDRRIHSSGGYNLPAATNFVCRTKDYLHLGGCHHGFAGYGWEDYQQIYMLERYYLKRDPLPGEITFENAPRRCRDEISRPKAKEIWERNQWLCLLHKWHSGSKDPHYKNKAVMDNNRRILLNWILFHRQQ